MSNDKANSFRFLSNLPVAQLYHEGEPKYRFNWNTAMALSPTNKSVLYIGAQFLFRSTNKGESWERLSPDLTTNDPAKQKQEESGGLSLDNSSAENHCTIFTIAESPLKEIDAANASFDAIIGKELDGINSKLSGKKLDSIKLMTKEEYDKRQQDK